MLEKENNEVGVLWIMQECIACQPPTCTPVPKPTPRMHPQCATTNTNSPLFFFILHLLILDAG